MTIYSLDVLLSYLEPVCCSMSSSNCCFLTCIQVSQEAGQVVWYSHLFQNFPQLVVIHTVKGFDIVNKAEIDVFLELFCFFNDPADVGNLIPGSSAFSKTSLNIWKFMVHILLKPGLENFGKLFGNKEFMIWATVSSWSCFYWLYRASPSLAAKNIINLILLLTIWWCSSDGKGQFSFQSLRKARPKNAQTTTQLHTSHTLVK